MLISVVIHSVYGSEVIADFRSEDKHFHLLFNLTKVLFFFVVIMLLILIDLEVIGYEIVLKNLKEEGAVLGDKNLRLDL